jgi:molybdopterin synthase catalytic subunit
MTDDPAYVAAQTGVVVHAAVTAEPLEDRLAEARRTTGTDAMGAVVTFEGVVRDHDGGSGVTALTYTSHPTATATLADIAEATVRTHPGVRLWVEHRVGPLAIGDLAFLVVVAAAHRGPAFAAVADVATAVKSGVPIWKEQQRPDGTTDWVGL